MTNAKDTAVSQNIALVVASISSFISTMTFSAINVAVPSIATEFSMGAVAQGWITTGHLLSSAAFLIPMGRLADIYGRRKVFLLGTILVTLALFLCATATSAVQLIAYRVFQGVGFAMIGGTCIAILTSVFPGAERGRALGINVASTYVGLSLGPFLGGVLTQHLGWRSIFYLTGILALVVAVLIFWKLRGEWADARGERFDYTGSVVFGVSLVVLLYGFTMLPEVLGIVLVVAGLLGLVGFGWWEGKVASPVFDVRLFRKNLTFIFSNLATMINYVAVYAVSFLLSLYLQDVKGISPQNAGLVLLVQPALQAVFSPLAGRLSDRMMPRKIASVGMALTAVSLVMFVFLDGDSGLWLVVASLAVLGLGIAFFASPNTNAIMGSVDKRFFGIASGSLAMMRTVGMALGMGITMILFAHYIGAAEIKPPYFPAFLTSMRVGFIIYAALCLIGVFFQLVTGGMKKGVADGKSVLG